MFSQYIKPIAEEKDLEQCQIFDDITFTSAKSNSLALLLTPICDIAQDDVDHFIFCAILPYEYYFFNILKTEDHLKDIDIFASSLPNGKRKRLLVEIHNIIGNRFERFHWIGKIPNEEGYWYVDYQLIQTVPFAESALLKKKRVFEVESPLNQSLSVRFSNYLGRIGLPFEKEDREKHANEILEYLITKKPQEQ